mgnify:CR=1 FL=1
MNLLLFKNKPKLVVPSDLGRASRINDVLGRYTEFAKITIPNLDVVESVHFTNVDQYDISYREDVGYRAWSWIDEKDVRGKDCRISFLKKVKAEWEEQKND